MDKFGKLSAYPGLLQAFLCIGYDNGAIWHGFREGQWIDRVEGVIVSEWSDTSDFQKWSDWLLSLDEDDLCTVAAGEVQEAHELLTRCPNGNGLNSLLNTIFDKC